jgi:8-oxo-dGTP pyrophosphatase MutT (NUDIX family)
MRTIYRDVAAAFIISKDNYILFGKSTRGTYEGRWIIPGGGVDEGETKLEAVIREVLEETGLDISGENIEAIEGKSTGESEKVLKGSEERVLGKYVFFTFVVKIDKNHQDIQVVSQDDFAEATWHGVKTLKDLKLPLTTVVTLKELGYLT